MQRRAHHTGEGRCMNLTEHTRIGSVQIVIDYLYVSAYTTVGCLKGGYQSVDESSYVVIILMVLLFVFF